MKFAVIHSVDKKVNKSLQDRLRRERISKSVEALRDLVLGPSIEHAKIGKADILKLTVQYIRRQKEGMETKMEDHTQSIGTYRRSREPEVKILGNNYLNKQSVCSTKEQVQTKGKKFNMLEKEVRSENAKTHYYDENYATTNLLPSQSQNRPSRSLVFRNTSNEPRNGGAQKRTALREINFNIKQEKNEQTIWRPW